MQRLLQAGARAGCRARPPKREGSAAQSSPGVIGPETDASAMAPFSGASMPRLSLLGHRAASACQTGQLSQVSAASEASPPQQNRGKLADVPCQAPLTQAVAAREAYTGSLSLARQHVLWPLVACSGRQMYASAAQAVASPPQQLFVVRQASNDRPALTVQRRARSPRRRAAIIAQLASSLGARGYVTESAAAEGRVTQDRTCREVTDRMIRLVEQGRADRAMTLFDPDFLLKEGGWEGAFLCDALLRACAALGEVQLMLLTVQSMRALGIPVGYVAHGCVLTGLGRAGRLEEAFQYLSQEVPIEAQTPGMYNSVLEAARRASDMQMASRVLQMMEDVGVAPGSRTAAAALRIMGSSKAEGAVHMYWAKLRPELKQHVAVHAAYVDALCMAAGVPEALSALRKMLDLFAAQHHHRTSLVQQPGQIPGADRARPASEAASHWAAAAPGSSSMGREDPSQPPVSSQTPLPQVQSAVSRDYLQNPGQGTSLQPDDAMGVEPPLGAVGLQLRMRQLEEGSRVDVIEGSQEIVEEHGIALRAAQAACHQVLSAAAQARQAGVPHKVLQAMHQAGVEADTAIYNSIMRQQAAAGSGTAALEGTLADMEAHGVQPDRRSLFLLLQEHSSRGDLAGAMAVMRRMAQLDIAPDRFTYNALLEAHTAAEDLEGVARVYQAMLTRGIRPDICTFIALFQALKSNKESAGFMQSGAEDTSWLQRLRGSAYVAPHELLAVWRADFEASGLQHTPASFTALVQALGQTQQIEEMLQVLAGAWAGRAAQQPSIYACNSAIGACARAGRLDDAIRLCSTMEQQGLRADAYTYSLLMNGFAHARRPDMAFKLFDQMREREVKPNVYIYNALIKAQASTGDLVQALQLLDVMEEAGVRPDGATWRTLLSQSRYLGRPDVAELVEARMHGNIQEWPQHLLQEGGPVYLEQPGRGDVAGARQGASNHQTYGFEEGDEDEDEDMFGGPRF